MPTSTPTIDQLKRALHIAEQIRNLESELGSILGKTQPTTSAIAAAVTGSSAVVTKGKRGRKKGKISPEGLARIRAAQQARWAKVKGATAPASAPAAPSAKPAKAAKPAKTGGRGGRRKISAEARARMAEAARRRWAAARKGK